MLEYGCQVWGKDKWPEGEKVQTDMAKRLLRCSDKTCHEAIRGDLGLWTLQGRRNCQVNVLASCAVFG